MNFKSSFIGLAALILMTGCSENTQVIESEKKASLKAPELSAPEHYQKPGAAIQLSHNYDGSTGVSETEAVSLILNHGYDSGTLSVTLDTQDGLDVLDDISPYTFSLDSPDAVEIPITALAEAEGKYYLSIFASVDDLDGNSMSRVFALAFNVGEGSQSAKTSLESSQMSLDKGGSGEEMILMPAEETITQ